MLKIIIEVKHYKEPVPIHKQSWCSVCKLELCLTQTYIVDVSEMTFIQTSLTDSLVC